MAVVQETNASFSVTPVRALLDEPVAIRLTGLRANQPATLNTQRKTASCTCRAEATFVADANGTIDLTTQAPRSGSYSAVDSMGLFWSMLPPAGLELPLLVPPEATRVELAGEADGVAIAPITLTRLSVADGVTAIEVRDSDMVGTLYLPAGAGPYPGVVVMGGSGGGLPALLAVLLASRGFASLALAYFSYADRPPVLNNIPLEYFEGAIRWLSARADVTRGGVGVLGVSRGGELVLLLGSTFPEIRAVVAVVPSHVVWPGVGAGPSAQSWTYGGRNIAMTPPGAGSAAATTRPEEQEEPIDLTPGFLKGLADETAAARAAIKIERIRGPVLLVSGKDDSMWPSALMSQRVMERLAAHKHPYAYSHLSYEGAGHGVGALLPFLPSTPIPRHHPVARLMFTSGGSARGNAVARSDAWPRVLRFLKDSLP